MSWRATSHFYGQLRSLVKSGMTLERCLELAGEHGAGRYRQLAPRWAAGCRAGQTLGEQLVADGERPLPAALVTAGERSGRLPELCAWIVGFYDEAIRIRALVVQRAIYPTVLLHLCTMIPVLPLWILGSVPGWAVLLGPLGLWTLFGLGALVLHLTRASGLAARLCTRFPLVELARPLVANLACLILRASAAAGMLWPAGLRLAADGCGNRVYAARLRAAADDIDAGRTPDLTAALAGAGFPREVVELVSTGEEAGGTEEALERAATLQQERFKARVDWTARIVMGIFYGIALLAAAATVVAMAYRFYIQPMQDVLNEL